jgi:predicted membrane protein
MNVDERFSNILLIGMGLLIVGGIGFASSQVMDNDVFIYFLGGSVIFIGTLIWSAMESKVLN